MNEIYTNGPVQACFCKPTSIEFAFSLRALFIFYLYYFFFFFFWGGGGGRGGGKRGWWWICLFSPFMCSRGFVVLIYTVLCSTVIESTILLVRISTLLFLYLRYFLHFLILVKFAKCSTRTSLVSSMPSQMECTTALMDLLLPVDTVSASWVGAKSHPVYSTGSLHIRLLILTYFINLHHPHEGRSPILGALIGGITAFSSTSVERTCVSWKGW